MHCLTFGIAAIGLICHSVAAPTPGADLDTRAYPYSWSFNTWRFSRGNYDYDYSFNIVGPANGNNPGLRARCSGTEKGLFKPCEVKAYGKYEPTISANVNIVTDPSNPNDNVPNVIVRVQFTDDEGCTYFWSGHRYATLNSGPGPAAKFTITASNPRAIC